MFRNEWRTCSGALLVRPGLERLHDLAAEGQIEAVLVYAPDRSSRKYAYQVLLIEELGRHGGVETKAPEGRPGGGPTAGGVCRVGAAKVRSMFSAARRTIIAMFTSATTRPLDMKSSMPKPRRPVSLPEL
jgi:hypothetical protein